MLSNRPSLRKYQQSRDFQQQDGRNDSRMVSKDEWFVGERDSFDLLAYETRLRNNARQFIARIRRSKEAVTGKYLLLRKKQQQRRLRTIVLQQQQQSNREQEFKHKRRAEIAAKLQSRPKIPKQKPISLRPIQEAVKQRKRLKSSAGALRPNEQNTAIQQKAGRVCSEPRQRRERSGFYLSSEDAWLLREIKKKLEHLHSIPI